MQNHRYSRYTRKYISKYDIECRRLFSQITEQNKKKTKNKLRNSHSLLIELAPAFY
jgi:hypothetical protein